MYIRNKVVVVTGGIRGIGFETVKKFLRSEAKFVAIIDIAESNVVNNNLARLAVEFSSERYEYFNCDVTDSDQFKAIFESIVQSHECVEILVNNAGTGCEKDVDLVIDVNFKAVVKCTLAALDYMDIRKGGRGGVIINVSSFLGIINLPLKPLYGATKHAVVSFVKSMKAHNSTFGVRIVCICPGLTKTTMTTPENLSATTLDFVNFDSIENYMDVYIQGPSNVADAIAEIAERGEDGAVWMSQNDEPPFAIKDVRTVEEVRIRP